MRNNVSQHLYVKSKAGIVRITNEANVNLTDGLDNVNVSIKIDAQTEFSFGAGVGYDFGAGIIELGYTDYHDNTDNVGLTVAVNF